ncbi:hypothetical protein [Streptomyces sp. NPDC056628]|uniref:hypothetical protein n=1 Tax=Streptomyces sp. NPDC056628 TaxID=3345882 RepID=UPI00367E1CCB
MQWLSLENVIAIGTSVLGLLVPVPMFLHDRRVPRRKRIGYRVQMDSPIGDGAFNPRLGDFDVPNMADASLVLLRIENDGSQSVADNDYTSSEVHGLTAEFTGRTVQAVSVTQPSGIEHLNSHFTNALLVLLSGGPAEGEVKLIGGLRDDRVHRNSAPKPDDKQRSSACPPDCSAGHWPSRYSPSPASSCCARATRSTASRAS